MALTDKGQENALRSALKADPEWNKRLKGWNLGAGVVSMKTPVSRLLEVARRVKRERPNATLRIDTAFGRVRLSAPAAYTRELAAKLKTGDLLVNNEWTPPLTVSYDVQPRTVSLSRVPKNDPFHAVPGLKVLVKNTGKEVVQFNYGCGGNVPVGVVTARGEQTPRLSGIGCTTEARWRLIQPGETVTFPSFSWNDVRKLKPGYYAWVVQIEPSFKSFAFRLTK
ncbi:hypothetical protein [Deinococcus sp. Marseille-Q6407]|uniref:hypothetical protein n=1 Tax=Deinococcus sp. Marseille-Q6407 TaxID=2969223 RepID=UPI0021C1BE90|nr:hypothetical protein [Deinococcus sp. Marseille-Q6407]